MCRRSFLTASRAEMKLYDFYSRKTAYGTFKQFKRFSHLLAFKWRRTKSMRFNVINHRTSPSDVKLNEISKRAPAESKNFSKWIRFVLSFNCTTTTKRNLLSVDMSPSEKRIEIYCIKFGIEWNLDLFTYFLSSLLRFLFLHSSATSETAPRVETEMGRNEIKIFQSHIMTSCWLEQKTSLYAFTRDQLKSRTESSKIVVIIYLRGMLVGRLSMFIVLNEVWSCSIIVARWREIWVQNSHELDSKFCTLYAWLLRFYFVDVARAHFAPFFNTSLYSIYTRPSSPSSKFWFERMTKISSKKSDVYGQMHITKREYFVDTEHTNKPRRVESMKIGNLWFARTHKLSLRSSNSTIFFCSTLRKK